MIDVIDLTQKLVRCASVTPADDGAQEVLKKPLRDMGFEIFNLPFEGDGSYPVQNFFARLDGRKNSPNAPHIGYCGHTDVVPAGDESAWTHPPFDAVIDGGIMYGRGTSDMKGGNAAYVSAISKFLKTNPNFDGSISLLIIGDEESDRINGAVKAIEWLKEKEQLPDFFLVGEPSNSEKLGEAVKIGRRGTLSGKVIAHGQQGHSAYPDSFDNPIPKLAKIVAAMSDYNFDEGTEFFSKTNLEVTSIDVGNPADNVIPALATLSFNIRFNTHWTAEDIDKKLEEIISNHADKYEYLSHSSTPPFMTEPNIWTDKIVSVIQRHTNLVPELSTAGGTSDAPFLAKYCPALEFGLTNKTIHQVDENLKISDLEKLVDIYADIIEKLLS